MSDFNAWLAADTDAITEPERAALAYSRILDKPSVVAFQTPSGATLANQTVRVEPDDRASMMRDSGGMTGPMRYCVVFGVVNHDTITDTDMQEGYRFILDNDEYRITDVIVTLGSIQGNAEVLG
jgi:hypothetical protein